MKVLTEEERQKKRDAVRRKRLQAAELRQRNVLRRRELHASQASISVHTDPEVQTIQENESTPVRRTLRKRACKISNLMPPMRPLYVVQEAPVHNILAQHNHRWLLHLLHHPCGLPSRLILE